MAPADLYRSRVPHTRPLCAIGNDRSYQAPQGTIRRITERSAKNLTFLGPTIGHGPRTPRSHRLERVAADAGLAPEATRLEAARHRCRPRCLRGGCQPVAGQGP